MEDSALEEALGGPRLPAGPPRRVLGTDGSAPHAGIRPLMSPYVLITVWRQVDGRVIARHLVNNVLGQRHGQPTRPGLIKHAVGERAAVGRFAVEPLCIAVIPKEIGLRMGQSTLEIRQQGAITSASGLGGRCRRTLSPDPQARKAFDDKTSARACSRRTAANTTLRARGDPIAVWRPPDDANRTGGTYRRGSDVWKPDECV